mmetsp:Transcript_30536/g.79229  ORF Transcript_30536/g.79229 Transcript_30536/m.79229 type:complete len:84 (-) Transcript_30536:615-866(-)
MMQSFQRAQWWDDVRFLLALVRFPLSDGRQVVSFRPVHPTVQKTEETVRTSCHASCGTTNDKTFFFVSDLTWKKNTCGGARNA